MKYRLVKQKKTAEQKKCVLLVVRYSYKVVPVVVSYCDHDETNIKRRW